MIINLFCTKAQKKDNLLILIFRAWIIDHDHYGTYFRVLFVDWGNIETLEHTDIKNAVDSVWTLRPMATPFRYTGDTLLLYF